MNSLLTSTSHAFFGVSTHPTLLTLTIDNRLLQIRGKFYELLTHCISATTIIRTLTFELMRQVDDELKIELIHHSAFYEHRIQTGTKAIFHLEAFVAKFMSIYKRFLLDVYD